VFKHPALARRPSLWTRGASILRDAGWRRWIASLGHEVAVVRYTLPLPPPEPFAIALNLRAWWLEAFSPA